MTRLAVFLATAGYAGYVPVAPGTVGTAVGLLIYAFVAWMKCWQLETGLILGIFIVGVWAATVAERYFGDIDPGPVVIDEVVGMLITVAYIPVGWTGALIGFVLFRIFDVIKPFPARRLEALHGGFGVMADDAMVAIYANLVMRLLWALAPGWIA